MFMVHINKFEDKYSFLHNDYKCDIYYDGYLYNNLTTAFYAQALDEDSPITKEEFSLYTAKEARSSIEAIKLPSHWDLVATPLMYRLLYVKFSENHDLFEMLISTGNAFITYVSDDDTVYGVSNGVGENRLGFMLMNIRDRLGSCSSNDNGCKNSIENINDSKYFSHLKKWSSVDMYIENYGEKILSSIVDFFGIEDVLVELTLLLQSYEHTCGAPIWSEELDYISQIEQLPF